MHDKAPPSTRRVESQLARHVLDGDRAAFAQLYDSYCTRAYSLARRICVDEGLAEDVVQEAFLSFWRDPGRFDSSLGSLSTWLMTMVHHKAVDAVRRETRQRVRTETAMNQDPESRGAFGAAADSDALARIESGEVRAALHKLPEEQRRIISLAYFEGRTQNEVAVLTGLPLGTVKSRTFAALRKLRAGLASLRAIEGQDPSGAAGALP